MSERLNVRENEIESIIKNINHLSRDLSGLSDSFYEVSAAINDISSSSIAMINSIKQVSEGLSSMGGNIVQSGVSQGGSTGGAFNLLGGIMGGIGAVGGIASSIIGIFTRRKKEEEK